MTHPLPQIMSQHCTTSWDGGPACQPVQQCHQGMTAGRGRSNHLDATSQELPCSTRQRMRTAHTAGLDNARTSPAKAYTQHQLAHTYRIHYLLAALHACPKGSCPAVLCSSSETSETPPFFVLLPQHMRVPGVAKTAGQALHCIMLKVSVTSRAARPA